MVDDGTVRFFLLGGLGGPPGLDGRPGADDRPLQRPDGPPGDQRPGPYGGAVPAPGAGVPPAGQPADGPRANTRNVSAAITSVCKAVDASVYGGAVVGGGPGGAAQLYDCQGAGAAIRAAGAKS
jgi:hypothetical protein